MRRKLTLAAICIILIIIGARLAWIAWTPGKLDKATLAVFKEATKVEVYRLDGKNGPYSSKSNEACETRIGGFLVTERGVDQNPVFAMKLAKILDDNRTYSSSYMLCYFPGVAYRVSKGNETIDILICFKCSNFYCGPPVERALENASFAFSPLRPRLVQLAKEAFPDDQEIQSLKE